VLRASQPKQKGINVKHRFTGHGITTLSLTMVKHLPQRSTRPSPPSLFPIDSIKRLIKEQTNRETNPRAQHGMPNARGNNDNPSLT
jgi:hypothetical protein